MYFEVFIYLVLPAALVGFVAYRLIRRSRRRA